ncbi:UNVERIFIED_ORG: hypothetical protein J2W82_003111 [Pseudomonas mohnii]|nr:hypothetical protein [Pseudomonas mohnii]
MLSTRLRLIDKAKALAVRSLTGVYSDYGEEGKVFCAVHKNRCQKKLCTAI